MGPQATEYCRRTSGGLLQNAEIAFRGFWYKLEEPQPLRRPSQTHLGPSARAPTDRGTWGFGKGVVSSDFADQWKLAIARAERRPSTWVGALGRGASSDAHGPAEKAELAFQSAES